LSFWGAPRRRPEEQDAEEDIPTTRRTVDFRYRNPNSEPEAAKNFFILFSHYNEGRLIVRQSA